MEQYVIHPDSLSLDELYGKYHADGEWQDGVLPTTLLQANNAKLDRQHWVVFDATVNSEWPWLLDHVVDPSIRWLRLPSGKTIPLKDEVCEAGEAGLSSPACRCQSTVL